MKHVCADPGAQQYSIYNEWKTKVRLQKNCQANGRKKKTPLSKTKIKNTLPPPIKKSKTTITKMNKTKGNGKKLKDIKQQVWNWFKKMRKERPQKPWLRPSYISCCLQSNFALRFYSGTSSMKSGDGIRIRMLWLNNYVNNWRQIGRTISE